MTTVGPRHSRDLRRKIEVFLPALSNVGRRLLEHPRARELYPEFLFTSHCIIRASVPLMEAARDRALAKADGDPVSAGLAPYFESHAPEEMDHDEWLLDDLEVIGRDRSAMLARPPSPTVAALVGAQYYWILHYHPVALLGYIAAFEGYPPSNGLIEELMRATGYEQRAFKTLLRHAELDPGHAAELDELLDGLPLAPEHSAVMGLSAMYSTDMYRRALDEVVERLGADGGERLGATPER
jgi:Iron-containing redox enzyme